MARISLRGVVTQTESVARLAESRRLLDARKGTAFDGRRDEAISRTFIASGARLAEITNLR